MFGIEFITYSIIRTRTVGTFKGRRNIMKEELFTIEDAGQWILDNSLEICSPNTVLNDAKTALLDLTSGEPYAILFEVGDTILNDGDDRIEIIEVREQHSLTDM